MKSIRLAPVRHEPPDCLDFDDEDEVRRYEVAMRVHRAHAEGYFVTPLEGRVDGAYQVVGGTGASGDAWIVDVVDASGTHDTCTCHDFLGNQLGTCKHLEAVRRAIARVPDLRRAFSRLGSTPRTATLTVTGIGGPRLAEVGPWKARLRARLGMVRNAGRDEVTLRDAAPLLPGLRDAVRVGSAFRPSKRSRSRSRPSSARPRLRRPDRALPGATASSFCSARTSRPRRPWYRRMQDAWLRKVAAHGILDGR